MPPKSKKGPNSEAIVAESDESSSGSESGASAGSVTTEQLEKILEANHKSMTALLASFASQSVASSGPPRTAQVKPPKWTDQETPFEYFTKFEKAVTHNGVEKSAWGQLLPVYLSGRAQAALAQVDADALDDYESVKQTLLESLGDTPASADRKWWFLSRQAGEEPGSFYLRVRATGLRKLHGLASKEEITEKVILSRFLSLLPAECYSFVVTKQPKTGLEAAKMVQEFEETRSFSRRRQPWKQDSSTHFSQYREQGEGGVKQDVFSDEGGSPQISDFIGNQGSDENSAPVMYEKRKPITCYGCGELGHIKPNCPNKIRHVVSAESSDRAVVEGWIAGSKVSGLRVDTGSERTIVKSEFVPASAYLNKTVILDSWRGKQFSKHRVAKILIKVGEVESVVQAAVVDQLGCPALLGNDLGAPMRMQLLSMLLEKAKDDRSVGGVEKVYSVRMTRALEIVDEKKDREDVLASVKSEAKPELLEDIFDFSESFFEPDPLPIPVEECAPIPEVCGIDIPLPEEVVVESDPLPLSEIFDFSDSLFEEDLVVSHTSVPAEVIDVCEIPLPEEVVRSTVQKRVDEIRLVQIDAGNPVSLTKATRETSPDRVYFCSSMFVVFLFVNLAWCVFFLYLLSAGYILCPAISDAGFQAVLWNLGSREELPKEFFPWTPQSQDRIDDPFPVGCLLWMKTLYPDLWSFRGGGRC